MPLAGAYAVFTGLLAVARHMNLQTNAFDLGYVSQALWEDAHGEPFRFTTVQGVSALLEGVDPTRIRHPHWLLAFHVEPALLLLAPLYRLWPEPRLLLWLQAIVVAAGALPAAWLARRLTGSRAAALACGLAWLLAPGLEGAVLSDFHMVALGATFLMFALWLLEAGHRRWAVTLFALTALCREDAAAAVACVGAVLVLRSWLAGEKLARSRPLPWLLAGGAGLWALACVGLIEPFFSGGVSAFAGRYAWLAHDPLGVGRWLAQPDVLAYLALQLLAGGVVALLAPLELLAALPLLAVNALSAFDWMRSGGGHYSALLVPLLLWAAIHGLRRLRAWSARAGVLAACLRTAWKAPAAIDGIRRLEIRPKRLPPVVAPARPPRAWVPARGFAAGLPALRAAIGPARQAPPSPAAGRAGLLAGSGLVLACGLLAQGWAGVSPLRAGFAWPAGDPRAPRALAALDGIPAGAAVSATSALYPHLSARREAYWFPAVAGADWLALDVAGQTHPLSPAAMRDAALRELGRPGVQIEDASAGVLVLRRDPAQPREPLLTDDPAQRSLGSVLRTHPELLPPDFYTFAADAAPAPLPAPIRFGPLELTGAELRTQPEVGLLGSSATLATAWRAVEPVPEDVRFAVATTRASDGALAGVRDDPAPAPLWWPTSRWQPGETMRLDMDLGQIRGIEAVGVAVEDRAGKRLPAQGAGAVLWDGGTIARVARLP